MIVGLLTPEPIYREIIDESDVYIDVHKAIRRMAPAPKAKYQRRLSHGHPTTDGNDGKSSEDTKVGEEEHSDGYDISKKRHNGVHEPNEHRDRSGSPMTGTFLLRRTSAGVDGRMENVPVRASYSDIRQHLKHLGPSNPASNPKATKSTTVKIKPGTVVQDLPRSNTVVEEAIQEQPQDEDDDGDETTSLLRGKVAPKDGVQALQQTYGATGAATLSRGPGNVPPIKVDVEREAPAAQALTNTGAADSTVATPSSAKPEQRSTSASDTSPTGSNSPYGPKKGLFARSGSITENVVESRGIRKVVLETTSSNSDEDEEQQGGLGQSAKIANRSNMSLPQPPPPEGDEDEEGSGGVPTAAVTSDTNASGAGAPAGNENGESNSASGSGGVGAGPSDGPSAGGGGGGGGGGGNSGGKKKNRRKKRKGGKF